MALLAPHHPAVVVLPRAYRTPLHLNSCPSAGHSRVQPSWARLRISSTTSPLALA